jgi:hypothetical protein
VIAPLLAVALLGILPSGAATYRFELGGEPIGTAELRSTCGGGGRCTVRWSVRTRAPEAGGGAIHARRVEVEVDDEGRWVDGPLAVSEDGVPVASRGVWGSVPVSLAELVLARARAEGPCIEVFDERSGEKGKACSRRGAGASWELDVRGELEKVRMGADGLPAEVTVPAQRARFVADPRAEIPSEPPRLYGVTVPGVSTPGDARRFCGVPVDPPPPAGRFDRLPPPVAEGANCREKTQRWLEGATRAGPGRTAVGVAWDGGAFSWHAWAEVQLEGRWIAVDPSFGQLPARGPRFTIARYADSDGAARAAAGRRVLECWGRARIE